MSRKQLLESRAVLKEFLVYLKEKEQKLRVAHRRLRDNRARQVEVVIQIQTINKMLEK
jgi:hypothetical protein